MSNYTVQVALEGTDHLSTPLEKVVDKLDNIEDAIRGGGRSGGGGILSGFNDLQNGLQNFASTVEGMPIVQLAAQLNEVGDAANDVETTFVQLAGGAQQADQMMMTLRENTGGIIDDMTLQTEASKALSLHLVDNADDMAQLASIGEKLGTNMGKTAAEGIDAFMSALASGRPAQLREIGIDAQAVADRVEILKQSGMDAMDAFRQAAFEQGAKQLEHLGAAALVGEGGLDKLQARLENIKQDLGQDVNNVVDAAATSLDQIIQIIQIRSGTHPMQEAAKAPAKAFVDEYYKDVAAFMDMGAGNSYKTDSLDVFKKGFSDDMIKIYQAIAVDPTLIQNRQALYDSLTDLPHDQKDLFIDSVVAAKEMADGFASADASNAAGTAKRIADARKSAADYVGVFTDMKDQLAGVASDFTGLFNPSDFQLWQQQEIDIGNAQIALNSYIDAYGEIPDMMIDVNNPDQVNGLTSTLEAAKNELVGLQDAADKGLISDTDLENSQTIVDRLQSMKDNVEKINSMGLKGLLGQDNADQAGMDLTNQVFDYLEKNGSLSDKQLEGARNTFDMSTGAETEASQAIKDKVIPMIADALATSGPEVAAAMQKNITEYLRSAKSIGLSDDATAAGLDYAGGYYRSGIDKHALNQDVNMHDYQALAGYDPTLYAQSLMSDTTVQAVQDVTDNTKLMGDNVTATATQFTEVNSQASTLQGVIADMASKVHTIAINLDIKNIGQLNSILAASGGGSGSGSAANNRANGGRAAGVDARTQN